MKIPFLASKKVLGLDIGSSAIKIVELEETKNKKWSFKKVAYETIGNEDLPPEERRFLLLDKLKTIVSKTKFSTRRVATSLSGNQVIVRYVKFPKITPEELAKTLPFEAEAYIPFNIQEVSLGFHILGDLIEEGQKKMETVLVAVKKEVIQNRVDLLEKADLEPVIIDIDAFALENALNLNRQSETKETLVAVNLGANVTNLSIVENGVSKVVRDIFIAGNTLTKAIQQNLNLGFLEAEELKKKSKLILPAPAPPEEKEETPASTQDGEVSKILIPIVSDLLREIQHSIEYYQTQLPEELPISKVLFTGGTAQLANLGKFFAQELQLPVEIYNPFIPLSASIPREISSIVPSFAIAVGLASRKE